MSAAVIHHDEYSLHHPALFTIGDRIRVPSIPHWPTGRITGMHPDGKPSIDWENGFVDVFNWLPLERIAD